jgi:serine/threonine protein kinase
MATVWQAWDERLQVWRAIKVLDPSFAPTSGARLRFENEARTMARLRHPHLLAVHDVGHDGDHVFLVMDLATGGSLADHLERQGPIAPRTAVRLMRGVIEALHEAHANGVVHRDVKPHNILLDADGRPLVADFGIARTDSLDLTRSGAAMGTLAYMAPEQRSKARSVDGRADVYAAAGTLYALITGREPLDLYVNADWTGIPEPLIPILAKATSYAAEARHPDANALAAELAAIEDALPGDPNAKVGGLVDRATLDPPSASNGASATFDTSAIPAATPAPPPPRTAPTSRWWLVPIAVVALAVPAVAWLAWPTPPRTWAGRTVGPQVPSSWAFAPGISADGERIYYPVAEGRVGVITVDGDVQAPIVVPDGYSGPLEAVGDGFILSRTSVEGDGQLVVVGPSGIRELGVEGRLARVSPDQRLAAYLRGTGVVRVVGTDGSNDRLLTDFGRTSDVIDHCVDGSGTELVALVRHGGMSLVALPLDGDGPQRTLIDDARLALPSGAATMGCVGDDVWYGLADPDRHGTTIWAMPVAGGPPREVHHWAHEVPIWMAAARSTDRAVFETVDPSTVAIVGDGTTFSRIPLTDVRAIAWVDDRRLAWIGYGKGGIADASTGAPLTALDLTGFDDGLPSAERHLGVAAGRVLAIERSPDHSRVLQLHEGPPTELASVPSYAELGCAGAVCVLLVERGAIGDLSWLDPVTGAIGEPFASVAIQSENGSLAVSPSGQWVASLGYDRHVYLVRAADGTTRTLDAGIDLAQHAAFTADETAMIVTGFVGITPTVVRVPLAGGPPETLYSADDGWLASPTISPDGSRIAVFLELHPSAIWVFEPED